MKIEERVELYKCMFRGCKVVEAVKEYLERDKQSTGKIERLEAIREFNTTLSDLYMVTIPVITVWVRDDSYVNATREIYLTEPTLGSFLHQFRHHLQNIERIERRCLTVEGVVKNRKIPYTECIYTMYGEDDAIAWSKSIIELANE